MKNKKLSIALLAMSMDIGGAETHVLTLADYLHRQGHSVIVISSGGVYDKDLAQMEIPFVFAPLKMKGPRAIVDSYKVVKKICKQNSIDIIHAHGRIPSLVGQMVATRLGIPMVTTVHAIYKTTMLYRFLSFYGKKTICISEDTKSHIMNNYGIKEDRIVIIPNGIDLEKFKPADEKIAIEGLSLDDHSFQVAYISRMTGTLAERAAVVTKALNQYAKDNEFVIELLLIGDGDDFIQLKETLSNFKACDSFRYHILGKRRDIPEILSTMDVSTCVSRAALESMASGTPVILVGGEGFEGVLDQTNYDRLSYDNFTARVDTKPFTEASFLQAFEQIAGSVNDEKRHALGKWLREKVEADYNSETITQATIKVYEDIIEGRK